MGWGSMDTFLPLHPRVNRRLSVDCPWSAVVPIARAAPSRPVPGWKRHRLSERCDPFATIMRMKTSHIRSVDLEESWLLYDASEHVLGRMAADIAVRLMGKNDPRYTPSELGRTHVVVINAEKVRLSGRKDEQKEYPHYSGYPGGLHTTSIERMRADRPYDVVKLAVRRMLPKTKLGKRMLSKMKVYGGSEHPHAAQKPIKVEALNS